MYNHKLFKPCVTVSFTTGTYDLSNVVYALVHYTCPSKGQSEFCVLVFTPVTSRGHVCIADFFMLMFLWQSPAQVVSEKP